ncbi:MAG: hypothetical protein GC189_06780 [Alphaproteobacteria bacterium]|nr:hypothetical protein [Alphaproteobacteria bacterium]
MTKRFLASAACAIALAGCATAPQYPSMRPLTDAHVETIGATPVSVAENNAGVEKAWFYTTTASAGAAYGLIGVLVTTAMDAIINAGPSRRAQKAADEMAELMPPDTLNASLTAQLQRAAQAASAPPAPAALTVEPMADAALAADAAQSAEPVADATLITLPVESTELATVDAALAVAPEPAPPPAPLAGVRYSEILTAQKLTAPDPLDDVIEIAVRYTLSEDSSTLRIIANASYQSPRTPYATRYTFTGSTPRAETRGPVYRNTFTYYSTQLPVPVLTPELRERLIASIQDSARDENGALPAEGTDEYRSMSNELEKARDDTLTKDEIAIFLTREWLRDDGARLREEVEQAHAFIARYVVADMNRTVVPSIDGADELLETLPNQRTVRRIGVGMEAGSYVSSAGNVMSFATYGNAIGVSRAARDRAEAIRDSARASQRSSR